MKKSFRGCAVLLALLCSLLLSFIAVAQEGDGVRARLAKPAVLRGEFAQEKRLHGFRNPLKSSGDFLLLRLEEASGSMAG